MQKLHVAPAIYGVDSEPTSKACLSAWPNLWGISIVRNDTFLTASSLSMRPARSADAPFLETLYRSTRMDIQSVDAAMEQPGSLVAQQYQVFQQGVEMEYPNAMRFVVEKLAERVGGMIVDFGANEIRLVYLALVPALRGQGYGGQLLRGLQQAAARAGAPLTVTVWRSNPGARALYLELGFIVEETTEAAERLAWYPDARSVVS